MGRKRKIVDSTTVLDEALAIIEAEGLEGFSTRKLSSALGLSPMTIYNYYENSDAIINAVALRGFDDWHRDYYSGIFESEGGDPNPFSAFRNLATSLYRFGIDRPKLYLFLFDSSLEQFRKEPRIGAWFRFLLDRCRRDGQDPQEFEKTRRDIYLFEVLVNGLVVSTIRRRAVISEDVFGILVDRAFEVLLRPYEDAYTMPAARQEVSAGADA